MSDSTWVDVGAEADLRTRPLQAVSAAGRALALTFVAGRFGALDGHCNHAGGPLAEGQLVDGYVVCPWHAWRFHGSTGKAMPGYEPECVPSYPVRVEDGRVLVDLAHPSARTRREHPPHPLTRPIARPPGPVRVVGISTTHMTSYAPRYSTSEALLEVALAQAAAVGATTELIRLRELAFAGCEGFFSKSAHACTWPCSITQRDPKDQLDRVYEAFVHGADVILVATPIRWGAPSQLYVKMVERMNCVQNQETIADRVLMKNRVVGFVITGGQDNVQAVAGQMLTFFSELGCQFPPFPFIAHSRGWSAEDMENNVRAVQESEALRAGARALAERCVRTAEVLLKAHLGADSIAGGGRKGHDLAG